MTLLFRAKRRCRQLPQQAGFKVGLSPVVGPTLLMLALNVLWNGLGNLAVGDKRGWKYGFANWVFFAGASATFGMAGVVYLLLILSL